MLYCLNICWIPESDVYRIWSLILSVYRSKQITHCKLTNTIQNYRLQADKYYLDFWATLISLSLNKAVTHRNTLIPAVRLLLIHHFQRKSFCETRYILWIFRATFPSLKCDKTLCQARKNQQQEIQENKTISYRNKCRYTQKILYLERSSYSILWVRCALCI